MSVNLSEGYKVYKHLFSELCGPETVTDRHFWPNQRNMAEMAKMNSQLLTSYTLRGLSQC